jgi:hypothetical protein
MGGTDMRPSSQGGTTFILGAGASRHAGYPFIASMGTELFAWMRRPRKAIVYDFVECADELEARFGDNIENVLKGIDAEIRRRSPDRPVLANYYRPALVEAMREWLADIHREHEATAYEQFATEIVKPGDRIITFNYDVSLDSCLQRSGKWSIGDGYGFTAEGLPGGSVASILKLHGSINWFAVLFRGMTGMFVNAGGSLGQRPAFCDADLSALGYAGVIDPLFPRHGSAAISPLILPTSRKRFYFETTLGREWENFWTRLWRKARKAVRESARIVVCGYGMQPIDRRGRNLLLRGSLEGDVEVCCRSDSVRIVEELRTHGRNANCANQLYFEEWVSAQTQAHRSKQ